MTLSERMVEAMAGAIHDAEPGAFRPWAAIVQAEANGDKLAILVAQSARTKARAALTAALAVAEEAGAGVFVVPPILTKQPHPDDMTKGEIEYADWRYAYEQMVEGIRATLAGRVTL